MGSQGQAALPGWPLGLPPVTFRMRLMDAMCTGDQNFLLVATPSFSSLSSSDFDTDSSIHSFFPEKSITLGSLIGIGEANASFRQSSVRSERRRTVRGSRRSTAGDSERLWRFIRRATCRDSEDDHATSLGKFLRAERQAAGSETDEKVYVNIMYEGAGGYGCEGNPLYESPATAVDQVSSPATDLPVIVEEAPEMSANVVSSNTDKAQNCPRTSGREKHRRSQSESACSLHCVSYVWGSTARSSDSWKTEKIDDVSSKRITAARSASSNSMSVNRIVASIRSFRASHDA